MPPGPRGHRTRKITIKIEKYRPRNMTLFVSPASCIEISEIRPTIGDYPPGIVEARLEILRGHQDLCLHHAGTTYARIGMGLLYTFT